MIGDAELADHVAKAVEAETNDHDRLLRVRELMGERLCQCQGVSPA